MTVLLLVDWMEDHWADLMVQKWADGWVSQRVAQKVGQ